MGKATLLVLFFTLPNLVFAETAILCGDLEKISQNEKNAALHIDYLPSKVDSEGRMHHLLLEDVKFLYVNGDKLKVQSVDVTEVGLSVTTKRHAITFEIPQPGQCDGESRLSASHSSGQRFDCICFED